MFNNSWYLRSSYMKQGKFRDFFHWNNAIFHTKQNKTFFGNSPGFTKDWSLFNIELGRDLVLHNEFADKLIKMGYHPINRGIHADPCYNDGAKGDLTPAGNSPLTGSSKSTAIELPDNSHWCSPAGTDIGAYQNGALIKGPSYVNFSE